MIRLLLTEVTPGAAESIRAMLASREEIEIVGYPRDGLEAAQMAARLRPDVMLVHDQLPEMPGTQACELTSLVAPDVACVLMCDRDDTATLKRAMRSGARMVLTPLTAPEELAASLRDLAKLKQRKEEPEYRIITDPSFFPCTLALVSARDGVGKSTLCVNLACALAQRAPDQVVVVDLCGQYGSVALLLNLRPTHSVVDLASFAADMDTDLVETFLERHPSGVRVLAGGTRPDPAWTDALSVHFIASLLSLLRKRYRYIICDVPSLVWAGSLYVMTRAQHCLVLASLCDVTGVREVAALMDAVAPSHLPPENLRLIVTRTGGHEWFSEEDVRNATRREIWHSIPNDAATIIPAAKEGAVVVTSKPTSAYARSVSALADKIIKHNMEAA